MFLLKHVNKTGTRAVSTIPTITVSSLKGTVSLNELAYESIDVPGLQKTHAIISFVGVDENGADKSENLFNLSTGEKYQIKQKTAALFVANSEACPYLDSFPRLAEKSRIMSTTSVVNAFYQVVDLPADLEGKEYTRKVFKRNESGVILEDVPSINETVIPNLKFKINTTPFIYKDKDGLNTSDFRMYLLEFDSKFAPSDERKNKTTNESLLDELDGTDGEAA
jgi:hypothetical protein